MKDDLVFLFFLLKKKKRKKLVLDVLLLSWLASTAHGVQGAMKVNIMHIDLRRITAYEL